MRTLLVFTDGRRECITQTLERAEEMLPDFDRRIITDDSADPAYGEWLATRFAPRYEISSHEERLGFGGTIQAAWKGLPRDGWVFHLEDDFLIDRPVPFEDMRAVLEWHPYLAQVALLRGAYFPRELEAGGIIEEHPESYVSKTDVDGRRWLEHRRFFTTNPCLYRAELTAMGWPAGPGSEQTFTERMRRLRRRFAFWGHNEPWVTHIGEYRAGTNY